MRPQMMWKVYWENYCSTCSSNNDFGWISRTGHKLPRRANPHNSSAAGSACVFFLCNNHLKCLLHTLYRTHKINIKCCCSGQGNGPPPPESVYYICVNIRLLRMYWTGALKIFFFYSMYNRNRNRSRTEHERNLSSSSCLCLGNSEVPSIRKMSNPASRGQRGFSFALMSCLSACSFKLWKTISAGGWKMW